MVQLVQHEEPVIPQRGVHVVHELMGEECLSSFLKHLNTTYHQTGHVHILVQSH